MAVMLPSSSSYFVPNKRRRRTATSVCAGDHDPRPRRDVLTSLLNGVPPNPEAEMRGIEHGRRGPPAPVVPAPVEVTGTVRKRGRPPKVRPAPLPASTPVAAPVPGSASAPASMPTPITPKPIPAIPLPLLNPALYGSRPIVQIRDDFRARSMTPPNMGPSSRQTTPGPSISSSTTQTSSKRPHTPDDGFLEMSFRDPGSSTPEPMSAPVKRPPRKKRNTAPRKGWKGWVEVSEDEDEATSSTKLISSEAPLVLSTERRTRSGRVV